MSNRQATWEAEQQTRNVNAAPLAYEMMGKVYDAMSATLALADPQTAQARRYKRELESVALSLAHHVNNRTDIGQDWADEIAALIAYALEAK